MKHPLLKTALLGASLLAAAPQSHAQNADRKWGLSGYATTLRYNGDLGQNTFQADNATYGGGLTLSRYLSKGMDINLSANQSTLRYPAPTGSSGAYGQRFYSNISSFGLGFKFKLNNGWALKEDAVIQPYILVQPGLAVIYTDRYNTPTAAKNRTSFGSFDGQVAAGLTFRLTPGLSIFAQAGQHMLFTDDDRLDGVAGGTIAGGGKGGGIFYRYDQYTQYSAGLTANFGKGKDTDGDGVSDRKDKCPDTPAGVAVDPNGCPLDKDGDGVPDYQDKCPDVAGKAELQGCPDRDNDGVADADDACPDLPGKAELRGCPDSDNDGVIDPNDKCPNTPAGVKVDAAGCPLDRDGDGVPDYQDRCPNRPGPASNKGCPEMKAETKKVLNEATKYIQFDFNKATLKPSSYPRLEQMVQIMNEYPDYSLSIAGHTDSKGADDYNLRLSYDRANSARAYMLSKGIPADRIEARGYGETKPIADNTTAAGQALNRRVDFDPYLTGESNAAEVKYGAAPTISELKAEGKPVPSATKKAPAKKAPVRKTTKKK